MAALKTVLLEAMEQLTEVYWGAHLPEEGTQNQLSYFIKYSHGDLKGLFYTIAG